MPKRFAAIDFDSRSLYIVWAQRTRAGAHIQKLTHAAIPEDIDTADANVFGAFLGKTLRATGVKAVVMNVPRGMAVLKPLQFPPGTAFGELAGMVQFQVEKELPFPLAEAVVDFTLANHYDIEDIADAQDTRLIGELRESADCGNLSFILHELEIAGLVLETSTDLTHAQLFEVWHKNKEFFIAQTSKVWVQAMTRNLDTTGGNE